MSSPGATPSEESGSAASGGLAGLLGRVLEQLAVSAWLPAVMLIGVAALLAQLRVRGDLNLAGAVAQLAQPPSWGILIVLGFGLVLATMVTQAFSFGAIRFLEGYWASGPASGLPMRLGIRLQVARSRRARERVERLERELYQSAFPFLMKEDQAHREIWQEQLFVPKAERKHKDPALISAANAIDWRGRGEPGLAGVYARSVDRLSDFPTNKSRFLPTRLGNVLRASEDALQVNGLALERFVLENYQKIPARLQRQHDQFRDRLDMYSLLVLVFVALSIVSVPALWSTAGLSLPAGLGGISIPAPLVTSTVLGGLGWISYQAAIASARGYGATLLAIDRTKEVSA